MARTRGGKRHLGQYRRRSQTSSSSGSQLYASGGEGVSAPLSGASSSSVAPRSASDDNASRQDHDGTPPEDTDVPAPALSLTAAELAKTRRRANRVDDELTASAHGNNRAVEDMESSENSESDSEDEWTGSRRAPTSSGKIKDQKAAPARAESRSRSVSSRSESEGSAPSRLPRRARSVSVRGYTWESERLSLTPVDIQQRLSYHKVFKTDTGGRNGSEVIKFRRDDLIYVLPDPAALDKRDGEEPMAQEDLPDEDWAVAQIADCCLLKSASSTDPDLPMLRVRWMYTPDEAKGVANLHKSYKARLDRYKFGEKELIYTDHFDFILLDCYAGLSEDHFAHVELLGLEVPDCERVGPSDKRSSKTLKEYVWMTGFDSKKKGRPPITKDASRNARSVGREPLEEEDTKAAASSEHIGTKKRKTGPGSQGKRVTKKAKRSATSSS